MARPGGVSPVGAGSSRPRTHNVRPYDARGSRGGTWGCVGVRVGCVRDAEDCVPYGVRGLRRRNLYGGGFVGEAVDERLRCRVLYEHLTVV